ncbi:hypothetical protein NIES2135_54080 [Leptolyngbya boryana NIES-2135]|jgi:hypothetical protein|uniref:Uncharacterized protein n=1 Tax=Leptolyngbya boryana NIES-2135 TaxID=1973484 RepID=A0A1Z4JP38_LEPBY|nr:hypothetical protein NIES2135_54080 [Leptolyngbya boryana NIES-2135]
MSLHPVGHWISLSSALTELESWEREAKLLGFGSAYLGFNRRHWTVLATPDLINVVLPF